MKKKTGVKVKYFWHSICFLAEVQIQSVDRLFPIPAVDQSHNRHVNCYLYFTKRLWARLFLWLQYVYFIRVC